MNRIVKRIWKSTWLSDAVYIVYIDEAGRVDTFEMPTEQAGLMCKLFDISKTHKAISYGCIPRRGESVDGGLTTSWCSCIQVCKDKCAGKNGYDIDAELVEAIVLNNGGVLDYSNVSRKDAS